MSVTARVNRPNDIILLLIPLPLFFLLLTTGVQLQAVSWQISGDFGGWA